MPSRIASVSGSTIRIVVPLPLLGMDFDVTAHFLNISFHHVHAHAAA
jgi:hypothetical protein